MASTCVNNACLLLNEFAPATGKLVSLQMVENRLHNRGEVIFFCYVQDQLFSFMHSLYANHKRGLERVGAGTL
jgi:hypothetical protein